jgi:hypothetical protein
MVEYTSKKTKLSGPKLTPEERLTHLENAKVPYDFRKLGPLPDGPLHKPHPNRVEGARKTNQTPGAIANRKKHQKLLQDQRKCEWCHRIALRGCRGCWKHEDGRKEYLRRQWEKGVLVESSPGTKYSALLNLVRKGHVPPELLASDAFKRVMTFIRTSKTIPEDERAPDHWMVLRAAIVLAYSLGLAWTQMEVDPNNRALWDQSLQEMARWGF